MWQSLSESIDFVHLNGKNDVDVESGIIDMTWEDVLNTFSTHDVRKEKDGPCFIPARMKPREEWVKVPSYAPTGEKLEGNYRKTVNVEAITCGVLDCDDEGTLENAIKQFREFEYFYVSTHSYTKETPYKYRLILRFAEPIPVEKWREAFFCLAKPIGADPACQDFTRFYYYPSVSPDAGVEPVFVPHPGRAMTLDDIYDLGKSYLQEQPAEKQQEFERLKAGGQPPKGKKHFTGQTLHQHEAVGTKLDYSYETLCKRHKDYIEDLLEKGHRHDFRMRVCSREVYRFGDKVSWLAVIQFMYRISLTNSAKPFTEGGARKDIPELILSAYAKNMPDLEQKDPEFTSGLARMLPGIIDTAHNNCISQRWRFPKPSETEVVKVPGVNALPRGSFAEKPDLNSMREEYRSSMKLLVKTGDPLAFADDVLNRAYSDKDKTPNIRALGQFVAYCVKGYIEKCQGHNSPHRAIAEALDKINQSKGSLLTKGQMDIEKKSLLQKQAAASIVLAKAPALGKGDWMFSFERPQQEKGLA